MKNHLRMKREFYLVEQLVHGNSSLVYSSPSRLCWTFLISQLCLISTSGSAIAACWEERDVCELPLAAEIGLDEDGELDGTDMDSLCYWTIGEVIDYFSSHVRSWRRGYVSALHSTHNRHIVRIGRLHRPIESARSTLMLGHVPASIGSPSSIYNCQSPLEEDRNRA